MKIQLLFIVAFFLLNCSSGNKSADLKETKALKEIKPEDLRISFDSLDCPINFEDVKIFSVSELNNKKSKVDEFLFYKLFQDVATDRIAPGGSNQIIPAIKHTNEYLLTKHNIDEEYDIITLFKETNYGNIIYWLSYFSRDTIFLEFDKQYKYEKGTLTNWGMLSREYENDTIIYTSYTKFVKSNKVIETRITKDKRKDLVDSIISFQELSVFLYNDGFKAFVVREKHYQNGKLISEYDDGYEWARDIK